MLLLSCLTALCWGKNISHDGDSNNNITSKSGFRFWNPDFGFLPWVPETFLARPKMCRSSANTENSRGKFLLHARKNSGTQGVGFCNQNAKSEKGFYLWEFSPQDGLCNIAFLLCHLIGMQKRIYKTVLMKKCSFFLLIMCVHLWEHCACKQFFFKSFLRFPKKKTHFSALESVFQIVPSIADSNSGFQNLIHIFL